MSPEEIREIRKVLNLTQEELAKILGVTKTSVARYEMQGGPKPQGDVERKLAQLFAFISDPNQKEQIKEICISGGAASIAGILAIGAVTFPVSAAAIGGITLGAILASPAALFLGCVLGGTGAVAAINRSSESQASEPQKDKNGKGAKRKKKADFYLKNSAF